MPLQNRVNPEGEILFSPARGTFMGNRGCLHNDAGQIVSSSKRDAWVTCLLEFQSRTRKVMDSGKYTELFFLDEATALAAGHRPCATCRRDRYEAFMAAWGAGNRSGAKVLAGEVDKQMKQDRATRTEVAEINGLPEGVIVKQKGVGTCFLIRDSKLYPWSFEGYGVAQAITSTKGPFIILTPASTVSAVRQGYSPEIHLSAL